MKRYEPGEAPKEMTDRIFTHSPDIPLAYLNGLDDEGVLSVRLQAIGSMSIAMAYSTLRQFGMHADLDKLADAAAMIFNQCRAGLAVPDCMKFGIVDKGNGVICAFFTHDEHQHNSKKASDPRLH